MLAPSSIHGVTSLVMGNCGVGFAPAKPTAEQHDWLIGMLEGVEDIPGTALAEGLHVGLGDVPRVPRRARPPPVRASTSATHVAHAPLRAYVMGERGADPNEAPTADELAAMAAHVRAGIEAGALGFTTSRTVPAPHQRRRPARHPLLVGRRADRPRRRRCSDAGTGVIQLISDAYQSTDDDFAVERDGR